MASTWLAIGFIAAVLAVPLAAGIYAISRNRITPVQTVLWGLAYVLVKLLWRVRWLTPMTVPPGKGAIVLCNHRSSADPFFLQTATLRPIHWMVAREYCEHPAFRWFLQTCEVIPVSRSGMDTAATKGAIRRVAEGGIVGMFPEGRINMTDELLLPGRPGAAMIALKARVPVVPCYIQGSPFNKVAWSPFFMPARVEVQFGPPVDLSDLYDREGEAGVVEEAMLRCLKGIAALAGHPDYQPKLAGKNWKPTREDIAAQQLAGEARRRSATSGRELTNERL